MKSISWRIFKEHRLICFVLIFFILISIMAGFTFYKLHHVKLHKPNIILIVADDLGWNDVGFHGSNQIPTPNIDALAYNGIILNRYYTGPSCSPSRTSLLTGNYAIRSGMQGMPLTSTSTRHIPFHIKILPEILKNEGYNTHLIGKWNLGSASKAYTPTRRGFDSHFGYWQGFIGYFSYMTKQFINPENIGCANSNSTPTPNHLSGFDLHDGFKTQWQYKGKYATDVFTKKALTIINSHNIKDKPLFLMFSHLAPHAGEDGQVEVPNIAEANKKYEYISNVYRRKFAEAVNILDKSIGKIVTALVKKKILDNTIIIFTNDNGAPAVGHTQNYGSNWPLRGNKFTLLEGGVKGTGIIFNPLMKNHSFIYDNLFHISDFLPTLFAASGGNVEELQIIDGINHYPNLNSELVFGKRKEILLDYDEKENFNSALISHNGRYKFLKTNENQNFKSYNNYYGDDGRRNVPEYNYSSVLESDVNKALQKLKNHKSLTREKIVSIREKLDLSSCREIGFKPEMTCTECLFDLFEDPCETRNIIERNLNIFQEMDSKLQAFRDELIPQGTEYVDFRSDPKYFNNTWSTWLDYHFEDNILINK